MNKKILSIFVMVMALSLLGVSCNKKTTDPTNNGGSTGPTTVTATQETLKKAALAGLGTTLKINSTGSKTITLDGKTEIELAADSITIAITDTSLDTANDGDKSDTVTSLDAVLAQLKTEMKKQGVDITAGSVGTATDGITGVVTFDLAAQKVADTSSTKYVLPDTITGLTKVVIKITIGSGTGSWQA